MSAPIGLLTAAKVREASTALEAAIRGFALAAGIPPVAADAAAIVLTSGVLAGVDELARQHVIAGVASIVDER